MSREVNCYEHFKKIMSTVYVRDKLKLAILRRLFSVSHKSRRIKKKKTIILKCHLKTIQRILYCSVFLFLK